MKLRMSRLFAFTLTITLALLLSACSSLPFGAGAPNVRITAPQDGATYASGVSIAVIGTAGGAGVRTVRVLINGTPVAMQGVTEMFTPVALSWMPDRPGTHVVHLEALDVDGTLLTRSDLIVVQVLEPMATQPAPTASPTVAATPTSSPTAVVVTATGVPTSSPMAMAATSTVTSTASATAAPTSSPTVVVTPTKSPTASPTLSPTTAAGAPTVRVNVPLANLRSGPGFNYPLAGQAALGDVLPIVGRDAAGAWWQVQQLTKTIWIANIVVQASASAREASPVVAAQTSASTAPVVAPTAVQTPDVTPTATPAATPTDAAAAGMPPCNENNPHWAVKESKDPGYTFCAAVPFEFVEQSKDGRMILRWHMYGIEQLELRIDPNGSNCGLGTTGLRMNVPFKADAYELNRRNFPRGGYKIGLWATLSGGRVQDYGELNFCGEG